MYCSMTFALMSCVGKLQELNNTAPQDHKLSEAALVSLEKLLLVVTDLKRKEQPSAEQINVLWRASHWPEGKILNLNRQSSLFH